MFNVTPARTINLLAAEGCLHLTFQQDKGLLEVVPVRWRPSVWRDVHINHAEASTGIFARHRDGIGVAYQAYVREVSIFVGLRLRQIAFGVVWRDGWQSG